MKKYRPNTPGTRGMTVISYRDVLTASEPNKRLTRGVKRDVGRNSQGRITSSHRGGGNKRLFREVDFIYNKKNIPARIESIEYDPNRTSFISLVCYKDGERRYVITPKSMKVGDEFVVSEDAPIKTGNRAVLANIPVGTFVYNIELKPRAGARMARSAGNYAEVIAHEDQYVHIKLPSTEVRKVLSTCWASIGEVSNEENRLVNIGKAGRNRRLGKRPKVRGTAMNPVDHPHGGGEGRQGRGRRRAVTATGRPVGKGQKTRRPKKYSNKFITSRRLVGKRK